MWLIRFSVPRQIVLHNGHLCRLCWNCVGFDGSGFVAVKSVNFWAAVVLKPFCFRCVIKCFFNVLISRNGRLHSEHVNGFSPVWIITCRFKFELLPNDLSQYLQTNAFLLLASMRGPRSSEIGSRYRLVDSDFSHVTHLVAFRPLTGARLHRQHLEFVLLLWTFLCFLKSLCSRNRRLQMSHSKGFSPAK